MNPRIKNMHTAKSKLDVTTEKKYRESLDGMRRSGGLGSSERWIMFRQLDDGKRLERVMRGRRRSREEWVVAEGLEDLVEDVEEEA